MLDHGRIIHPHEICWYSFAHLGKVRHCDGRGREGGREGGEGGREGGGGGEGVRYGELPGGAVSGQKSSPATLGWAALASGAG